MTLQKTIENTLGHPVPRPIYFDRVLNVYINDSNDSKRVFCSSRHFLIFSGSIRGITGIATGGVTAD
uniref:Uncharacterized protein n=1 Tax=Romanomermis culicivorax TaxID=13658 RepID=A0A915K630_ROMCU